MSSIIVQCANGLANGDDRCKNEAYSPCPDCGLWYCKEHYEPDKHRCKS